MRGARFRLHKPWLRTVGAFGGAAVEGVALTETYISIRSEFASDEASPASDASSQPGVSGSMSHAVAQDVSWNKSKEQPDTQGVTTIMAILASLFIRMWSVAEHVWAKQPWPWRGRPGPRG